MICRRCAMKNPPKRQTCRYCGASLSDKDSKPSQPAFTIVETTARPVRTIALNREIAVSTRFAYRILTSHYRYRSFFLLLMSMVFAALFLSRVGMEMPRIMTEAVSQTTASGGFEAWRMAWSGVIVSIALAGWLGFGVLAGYKMLRIRYEFNRRGRRMEPLTPVKRTVSVGEKPRAQAKPSEIVTMEEKK